MGTFMYPNFPYQKGSIWRKWDLQAQTILDDSYTSLAQYAEEIKRLEPTLWSEYLAKVGGESNALLFDSKEYFNDESLPKADRCLNYVRNFFAFIETFNPDLECIGITDHNYFDDTLLDTFVSYAKNARLKIIPGIEINCQGIHMLVFFSMPPYGNPTFSEDIRAFLGTFDIHSRTTGAGVLTTTAANIKEIINEVKKIGGVIIYPHCNSDNGLFQERTKTDRTHLADIFNHQRMNLLQARHQQSTVPLAAYIKTNDALKSKFCTHISSDARALRDYGAPDQDGNYLWVKSNPTFEGLKQINFEPEQRICVATQKPGGKKSYFIINSVRFLDNTNEQNFGSEMIEINKNLTTIVGGKSTGKSLLLYYTAKTIDPQEVEERVVATGVPVSYDFDADPNFNFEVTWEDGQKTLLKVPEGSPDDASRERKILYIPQKYLNTLSEANIKSREALNEFVLNVILQDAPTAEKYREVLFEIKTSTKSIQLDINQLFSDREDIGKTEDELKQAGDEKGIEAYTQTLQGEVDGIKLKSGLTEEQIKEYESLTAREKDLNTQVTNLDADKKTVRSLQSSLASELGNIRSTTEEYGAYLNDVEIKAKLVDEIKVVETFAPAIDTATTKVIAAIEAKLKTCNDELIKIRAALAPLLSKVQLQTELQQKMDAIGKEQQKLNDISVKKNALKTKREAYSKKVEDIADSYKQIIAQYEILRNEFKKFESRFGEITLGVHVAFNNEAFNAEVVKEYLNKTDLKRVIVESEWGEEFVYEYDPATHLSNMDKVFQGLLGGTISTLRSRPVKDATMKLLDDYFYIDFRIFYKNDSLDKMSPGKKGLVLLQLLINLSDEEWPILLDQPEDDLDNRSVYDDLVAFLKDKKLQRQILIVTHNPNLVVGADAEEVIVANQSGQEIGRENKKYRFEHVSGALENTFELTQEEEPAILLRKGIRQHVCEILEGGKEAFQKRERKYNFPQ